MRKKRLMLTKTVLYEIQEKELKAEVTVEFVRRRGPLDILRVDAVHPSCQSRQRVSETVARKMGSLQQRNSVSA